MSPEISVTYESGDPKCIIRGYPEEVQTAVDRIFQDYDPRGYNTTIRSDEIVNGIRTVVITRWSSCD
jgi:hypothetical protein